MKTYVADIIPKIQRFSQKLDDLTKLMNQHWVSIGDINQSKCVYIFRPNNQLLISENGIVQKGSWEYLGSQSLLFETKHESYLLKHGFFDENVIALKLDSTDHYAFFVNETKYHSELNNINDILKFLETKYIISKKAGNNLGTTEKQTINEDVKFSYKIISEKEKYDLIWGNFIEYEIIFADSKKHKLYKGRSTSKYFYLDSVYGRKYFDTFEQAVFNLYIYLNGQKLG
ncbi:hypothetical protein OCK74_14910 [Chitinophagaceae bacterium LB-8]|uniref:Uncharacterized protein n=1 Tax=Paraflavisolibacter caeni TaxID=2982496 RepID=A0A9X2XPA8_9BACT|nr:hypothetical protein [Paraflavisolibacter caeni]MCU7550409.1 hypothetical protein [Paraflavisolibacter caeni]